MMVNVLRALIVPLINIVKWELAQTSKKLVHLASIEMSADVKLLVSSIIQDQFLEYAKNT